MSKQQDTIDKAYGNVPKEVNYSFSLFDWIPTQRGIKYYWLKYVRYMQGRGNSSCDCGHKH